MPFIKLNSSKINYQYSIGSDNFIVSQIVDSSCSYETPIVIRDEQSLRMYFGNSFPEKNYFSELLKSGVSLLLYKPVSATKRLVDSIEIPETRISYLCFDDFPKTGESGILYFDSYTKDEYIWYLDEFVNIKNLPQNLFSEDNYESWYNRDSLRLCSSEVFNLSEKYLEGKDFFGIIEQVQRIEGLYHTDAFSIQNDSGEPVLVYNKSDFLENSIPDLEIPINRSTVTESYAKNQDFFSSGDYEISIEMDNSYGLKLKNLYWLKNQSLLDLVNFWVKPYNSDISVGLSAINVLTIHKIIDPETSNGIIYCHPRYETESHLMYRGIPLIQHFGNNGDYLNKISTGERTLAFDINFSKKPDLLTGLSAKFICLPAGSDVSDARKVFIWFNRGNDEPPLGSDVIVSDDLRSGRIDLFDSNGVEKPWDILLNEIESRLEKYYRVNWISDDKLQLSLYSIKGSVVSTAFTNIEGLQIEDDFQLTQDLISLESESRKRLEFFSKTIGPSDENIKLKVEAVNYYTDKYRITISRSGYQETYDVNLYEEPDKDGKIESLESIINRSSKLVRCKLYRENSKGIPWRVGDLGGRLPIGEWELTRATHKTPTADMYWEGLKFLSEYNVSEDFILFPEIEKYLDKDKISDYEDLGYFPEYLEILNYCKHKNCQALIGNLDISVSSEYPKINEEPQERTIYTKKQDDKTVFEIYWNGKFHNLDILENNLILSSKNTYIYNYNQDSENRLVYFLRNIYIAGYYLRPPYYLFLKGLLSSSYSPISDDIGYISPLEDIYEEFSEIGEKLENKKVNYLVSNNQTYFYKNFQNHPGDGYYETTILSRFALTKITRTLINNQWDFLGNQLKGEIREKIEQTLLTLQTTYNLYKSITITDLQFNHSNNSLIIKLKTYLRELVDKPIYLDVELNYIN